MRRPLIIAHRGYSAKFPENTALAFREALSAGADGVECDVQKTRDGRYVILHDATVDRTSNGKGDVSHYTLEELRQFDFGRGERILELSELMALMPADKWLNIEVKQETISLEDCRIIADLIVSQKRAKLLVSSFDHVLLPVFRKRKIRTGALVGEKHGERGPLSLLSVPFKIRPTYLNMPILAFEKAKPYVVWGLIAYFRAFGTKIVFWTVNDRAQAKRVRAVSSMIITDEVSLLQSNQ
jgi:glycerophosphoryl diester phosphodiesterase